MKWFLYYPVLVILCFEVALLILGYRAYKITPYKVETLPKAAFVGDELLGIRLNPGVYEITLNDSVQFTASHFQEKRITPNQPIAEKKHIAMLGCSFTYGYGVNDSETFTTLLQDRDSTLIFDNFGVIGYGTVQNYLQCQSIIESGDADVIILNFSSFHFMRNTLSEAYRKNLKLGYANSSAQVDKNMKTARFPFVSDTSLTVNYANWSELHSNWFLREWSATINWFQTVYEGFLDNKKAEIDITSRLILEMNRLCSAENIAFGIVCLDQTVETESLQKLIPTIPWVDVDFDFKEELLTHLPFDSHPNKLGHEFIANKAELFIQTVSHEAN